MRALITVFDKRAVVEFAQALQAMGVAIVSTGGTARKIAGEGGVTVTKVEDLTGFPEIVSERGREREEGKNGNKETVMCTRLFCRYSSREYTC